jgi:hypothetical protein
MPKASSFARENFTVQVDQLQKTVGEVGLSLIFSVTFVEKYAADVVLSTRPRILGLSSSSIFPNVGVPRQN